MTIKITATMRRMINDREFYDAISELIEAENHRIAAMQKLRDLESLRRDHARYNRSMVPTGNGVPKGTVNGKPVY